MRPPGADEQYGKGHKAASGGALRFDDWNLFVDRLGYGPDMHVKKDRPMTTRISRLGFPVKVMARDDLKSNDTRRHASAPHLKVSLGYVDQILDHLDRHDIRMYRMSSDLAPMPPTPICRPSTAW